MNQKKYVLIVLPFCFLFMASLAPAGVQGEGRSAAHLSPSVSQGKSQVSDPSKQLESLIVDVNGERRRADPASGIEVVVGDLLTIVDAYLVDKSQTVKTVDLIGFRSRVSKNSNDDRGRVIDTGRNLSSNRSLDKHGRKYRIEASGPEGLNGTVVLTMHDPQLLSFDLEINGERQKFSSGDILKLNAADSVRVVDVRTNVRGNEDVKYLFSDSKYSKELRFLRGTRVFARIPIEWRAK